MKSLLKQYKDNPPFISKVLDIAQELDKLLEMLDFYPNEAFTFDLAASASRRNILNLPKFINESIELYEDTFCLGLINFLADRFKFHTGDQPRYLPVTPDIVQVMLQGLRDNMEYFPNIKLICRMMGENAQEAFIDLIGPDQDAFPKEVEEVL